MTAATELHLMTAAEVASILRINVDKVRTLAAKGLLPGSQIHGNGRGGRTWRFTDSDVTTYLQSCRPSTTVTGAIDDGHARRRTRRMAS